MYFTPLLYHLYFIFLTLSLILPFFVFFTFFMEMFIYYCMQCIHSDSMTDTTMRIKKETKMKLQELGSSGDSLNDVVEMLLQTYEKSITTDNFK